MNAQHLTLIWDGERAPFAKAFIAAQKATEAVKKAASNPAFKSKYADLSEVVEATVPALNANGIGVIQAPGFDGEWVKVTTVFLHESGASVTGELKLRPSKTDPQGVGSAITYGRRYSLLAMTGTAPEDDDGNAASGPRQDRRDVGNPKLDFAIAQMRAAKTGAEFADFWKKNKDGLRQQLNDAEWRTLLLAKDAEVKRLTEAQSEDHATSGDFPGDAPAETPFDEAA